jgi:hypothetical protein
LAGFLLFFFAWRGHPAFIVCLYLGAGTNLTRGNTMNIITVTAVRSIKIKPIYASQGEEMLVDLAIASFGHLLRSQLPREYSLNQFADIIASNYDVTADERTQAVVEALRAVQASTERQAQFVVVIEHGNSKRHAAHA